jgi:predicted dehydrogenase
MIRFALIGLGNIGRRHAEHILNHSDAELIAVCDCDTGKHGLIDRPFYTSIDALLSNEKVDVVSVCTPNYLHEPHAVAGLNSGAHVIVEKPMALSVAECDRMIAAAEAADKLIFAVKQNRYNPPVAAVKDLIESDRLGKIYLVQVNCFWNRSDNYYAQSDWRGKKAKDGGCLFTQFSHFVDILYYLNGTISSVQGAIANFAHQHNTEFEDTGSFVMQGANGSLINFNFTTAAYAKNMEGAITLFGEKGTVKIGGQYLNTIEYQQLEGEALPPINISAKNNDYGLYQGSMSNHDKLIDNVVRVLQHGEPIMTTASEGREVVRMIEMMYESV